jgi:SAM-dependent methyltransferase
LVGLDVSGVALSQLAARAADTSPNLAQGDLGALAPDVAFSIVIGIQVFQHGRREEAHAHVEAAARRVLPGGVFCLRVNAAGTDIHRRHRLREQDGGNGFTVEYREGPKTGLAVHFFAEAELAGLLAPLEPVMPLRVAATRRASSESGHWLQWEGIWRRNRRERS